MSVPVDAGIGNEDAGVMTAPVDELMQSAVKARQRAQSALVQAVREARAADWSWERISSGLGGVPSPDALRRAFAAAPAGGCGCGAGCGCGR